MGRDEGPSFVCIFLLLLLRQYRCLGMLVCRFGRSLLYSPGLLGVTDILAIVSALSWELIYPIAESLEIDKKIRTYSLSYVEVAGSEVLIWIFCCEFALTLELVFTGKLRTIFKKLYSSSHYTEL